MSFASNHSEIVKLNNYNLRDLGGTASFEVSAISGRGLPPTRERELQFPGEMGARDYGSYYGNRRIELSGMLYADSINDFRAGLNKIKELCRLRTFVDGILYEQVEAQMLWFADESVVAGPYTLTAASQIGPASSIFDAPDAIGNFPSAYSSDDDLIGFDLEFANRGATAAPRKYTINSDGNVVSTGRFFCSPYYDTSTGVPTVGDTFWIVDNRYYLVNYSGTMNEERLTAQWFKIGYSRLTLPFKAVYPFAVSDPKKVDFTPNATNGYFKSLSTGNAISYPVYKVKGAANTPQIVEATHSLVWNANDNNASNILGESVSATVSAAGFYGQTGKLNQAIAFDANQDRTKGDGLIATNIGARNGMGIGGAANLNQGTLAFWFKKPGDYETHPAIYESIFGLLDDEPRWLTVHRYTPNSSTNQIQFYTGAKVVTANIGTDLTAGNWYYFVGRWDCRRPMNGGANYLEFQIYDAGSAVLTATSTAVNTNPSGDGGNIYLAQSAQGYTNRQGDFLLDDMAIWDRPLTDTERNTLVNSGTGVRADTVASSELVYYSDFDQTVGTTFDATQIASSNVDTMQTAKTNLNVLNTVELPDDSDPNKIFFEDDRVVLYDETGYKVQGLVADAGTNYVDVDNGSGDVVTDIDKVGVYGTLNGTSEYMLATGTFGSAADVSWSCWFKTTSTATMKIMHCDAYYFDLRNSNGTVGTGILSGGANYVFVSSGAGLNDGKWHHAVATYDHGTTTLKLYIDGVEVSTSSSTSGSRTTTAGSLMIGNYAGGTQWFDGSVRDVATWTSTELSASNALTLATNPITGVGTVTGAYGHWELTDAASETTPQDATANNNDLTLYGGTTTNYGTHSRTQLAYISKNLIADANMENGGVGGWDLSTDSAEIKAFNKNTAALKDAQAFYLQSLSGSDPQVYQRPVVAAGENYILRAWIKSSPQKAAVYVDGTYVEGGTGYPGGTVSGDGTWAFQESSLLVKSAVTSLGDMALRIFATATDDYAYFDDLKLLPNLVDNGGMEGGANPPTGVSNDLVTHVTLTSDTDEHSGTYSLKAVIIAGGLGAYVVPVTVADRWYEVSCWAKVTSGTLDFGMSSGATSNGMLITAAENGDTWKRYSFTQKAEDTYEPVWFRQSASTTGTFYIDDVSVVHRPDLSVSFNNMTNGYRFEPTRLTRGYKAGLNEEAYFDDVIISPSEYAGRMVVRPQFPSDTGELYPFLLRLYEDTDNFLEVYYLGTSDKFVVAKKVSGTWLAAYSPVMSFAQDEEIEIGWSFDSTNGLKVFVNGSNTGATNQASTTTWTVALAPSTAYIGFNGATYPNDYIIDDLEILAKSQPAEWFAEKYAKRNEARNLNLPFKYSSTLNAGDILTINALDPKVRGRVEMYQASSGATSNQMGVSNVAGSMMPILSPTKSMLYFPNSIPSGVEIYYRENHQ